MGRRRSSQPFILQDERLDRPVDQNPNLAIFLVGWVVSLVEHVEEEFVIVLTVEPVELVVREGPALPQVGQDVAGEVLVCELYSPTRGERGAQVEQTTQDRDIAVKGFDLEQVDADAPDWEQSRVRVAVLDPVQISKVALPANAPAR